jgi:hypothetical protein
MKDIPRIVFLSLTLAMSGACGGASGGAPAATVRDSAGIAIVENVFPDSTGVAWWTVEEPPRVDIGSAEADEEDALFQVGDALRLSDGRIVVTNGGAADVRYYAADGAHVRTSGRRGEGPGEFRQPRWLFPLAGDSVLVVDGRRASVLDPNGEFVRDFLIGGTGAWLSAFGRLADGSLIAAANLLDEANIVDGFQRPGLGMVRVGGDGAVLDTLTVVPGAEGVIHTGRSGGVIATIEISMPPFAKRTVYTAAGDVIVVGTQDAPQVEVYDADGMLRRIVRTNAPMPVVTEEHLEAWYQRQREQMPAELRAQFDRRPEYEHAGKVVPPYAAIELDDGGNIWILDFDDRMRPAGRWSVHDAEGRLLARIALPERFRPLHIGTDFILGVDRDELDVEHVQLFRLIRDGA